MEVARQQRVSWFSGTLQASNVAMRRILAQDGARMCPEAPGVLRADVYLYGGRRVREPKAD